MSKEMKQDNMQRETQREKELLQGILKMTIDGKYFNEYKEDTKLTPCEEKVQTTIRKSKEIFLQQEEKTRISYFEFLWGQFRLIKKRWWLLQALLLVTATITLPFLQDKKYELRILGIIGVLFVVLMIPEFWKNKSNGSMQVESTCLYPLRQIYAARMLLFGLVDLFILSCFYILVRGNLGFTAKEVLTQFLFPMLVTVCICFGTLCSNVWINEATAILFCLLWSVVWSTIVMNQRIYEAITLPVWGVLFGLSVAFLIGAAYKIIHDCNQFWEVNINGITNH